MGRHLSPRYGQVILVSGYPVLTAVKWSQHWCAISFLLGSQTTAVARKCESKHWFPYGADGRSAGGQCTVTWLSNFLGWVELLISSKEVPNSWKRGNIVSHFKKDLQLEKVNYRPVIVLSSLSKVFEHILHQQLADRFENISHKYMFGYRRYHGCPTSLLSLTEQSKEDLDKHNVIGTIAIDLRKAFDCLSHDLILEDKLNFK